MSGSVLHSMLPLDFSEINRYLTVFVLGNWMICGPTFGDIPQKGEQITFQDNACHQIAVDKGS